MPYLWFSSPVPVTIKTGSCQNICHVEEAAEILLHHWPREDISDPLSIAARQACLDALQGRSDIENARTAFEAAARDVGILEVSKTCGELEASRYCTEPRH
jgi:hypothetical protein